MDLSAAEVEVWLLTQRVIYPQASVKRRRACSGLP